MPTKLYIAVIVGTSRQRRESIHAARFIAEVGKSFDEIETILVDPQELTFPYDGNDENAKDPRYTEITEKADGFFIVTPEYNHSFPGSLKRLLDSELKNYIHKPVAFAGVSSGPWGGVRAIESLVGAVREMGLATTFTDVQFPQIQNLFNADGGITDERYIERVRKAYVELIWMAKVLKYGREHISKG